MTSHPLLRTLLALLLASLLPATTVATCNVGYSASCDAINFTVTSQVFFNVNYTQSNEDETSYNATVIFHWGPENVTLGPALYNISDPVGLGSTYQYEKEGYYPVGYTLIFNDENAAGCSGNEYGSIQIVKLERTPTRCIVGAETPPPTGSPTLSMAPSMSSAPTVAPIDGTSAGSGAMRSWWVVGLGLVGVVAGGFL